MSSQWDLLDLIIPLLDLGSSAKTYPEYIYELISEVRSDPIGQWFLQRRERKNTGWDGLVLQEAGASYTGDAKYSWEADDDHAQLQIDLKQARICTARGQILLTPTETRLLACLARQPGLVVSHSTLSEIISQDHTGAVWADAKHHIRSLRIKMGDNLQNPRIIRNRRGMGYYLDEKMKGHIRW